MPDLLQVAQLMFDGAQQRLATASTNIAQAQTPGYKRSISFSTFVTPELLAAQHGASVRGADAPSALHTLTDHASAALSATGRALDFALTGPGFFQLRDADGALVYTRSGQFTLAADGRLTDAQGRTLQTQSGEDLVVSDDQFTLTEDGLVLDQGLPVARIGVFAPEAIDGLRSLGGTRFAPDPGVEMLAVEQAVVRQGMLESANVDWAAEMVSVMAGQRQMEMGAQLVRTYDSLLGQAVSTFGGGGR